MEVNGLTGITAIAGGGSQSFALKDDGTVWAWGWNPNGELGNGTTTASTIPIQVSSLTNITAISGGAFHALAMRNDGTVWAWGSNVFGQLGDGSNTDSHVPVQLSALSSTIAVAAGYQHSLARKNDGTGRSWGNNGAGALGDGGFTNSNTPVQVIGLCATSSVAGSASGASITVFPNPTNGKFTLEGLDKSQAMSLEIRDMLGREVLLSANTDVRSGIDLSTQPDGIYFLSIRIADGVRSAKLIKQ